MEAIRTISPFPLRLRDDLRGWLKDRATRGGNSLNTEIAILLEAVKGQIERNEEAQHGN